MKKSLGTIGVVGSSLMGVDFAKPNTNSKQKIVIVYDDTPEALKSAEEAKLKIESEGKEVELMSQEAYGVLERQRETFGNPNTKYLSNDRLQEAVNLRNMSDELTYGRQTKKQRNQVVHPIRTEAKIQRNDPCSCGSQIKYKKCCGK